MAPKKRPWFRFYVEAVHDRKLRRQKPETRWLFVACLAAARQSPIPGLLLISERDAMDSDDLADFAGMTLKQVEVGMEALVRVGVVDIDDNLRCWCVPNWNDRQFESDDSTTRAAKSRRKGDDATTMQRPIDGDTAADATPPENREQRTDTERCKSVGNPPRVVQPPPQAAPLPGRISEPRSFVEIVEPSGPIAIRRETSAVLDEANRLAPESPVTASDRKALRSTIEEAITAGYTPTDLANAVASSPFRTPAGVMGELRKRKQQPQRRPSVGDAGLSAAAEWLEGREGA